MKGGRSSSLPAKEITHDPPADDSDDEEAEGQRMLEDAPEAGCSLGKELRVAVEKEEGDVDQYWSLYRPVLVAFPILGASGDSG